MESSSLSPSSREASTICVSRCRRRTLPALRLLLQRRLKKAQEDEREKEKNVAKLSRMLTQRERAPRPASLLLLLSLRPLLSLGLESLPLLLLTRRTSRLGRRKETRSVLRLLLLVSSLVLLPIFTRILLSCLLLPPRSLCPVSQSVQTSTARLASCTCPRRTACSPPAPARHQSSSIRRQAFKKTEDFEPAGARNPSTS